MMIERCAEFAGRAGAIAGLAESYSHVEVIVSAAGIVLYCPREIIRSFFLIAAGDDYSQIVVDLGERQSGGHEFKGAFGFREVSVSVGGQAEIEICLACYRGGRLNLAESGDGRFVIALSVVSFAEFQPCLGVIGIEAGGFAIVLNFFFSG